MNWLVFDDNYLLLDAGFRRLSATPKETGQNVAHEKLSASIQATQAGYVYVFISNEETTPVEVYWDDFKVEHVKSPVISSQDFYPFGLAFKEYQRENSLVNQFQYNGKELQDELNVGWLDYGARNYYPEIGKWLALDPMSEMAIAASPYGYVNNNPVSMNDPTGMISEDANGFKGLASTFVNKNSEVIEHRDDGDRNVYLVDNPAEWNGKKRGLKVVGEEDPGKVYNVGDSYIYYSSNSNGYDPASLFNYLNNVISAAGVAGMDKTRNSLLNSMAVNFIPVWDESGKVIGLMPKGKGVLPYTAIRYVRGVFEYLGPAGDVVFTAYNVWQFSQGNQSGAKLTYNVASTGVSFYTGFAYGGPAGVAVGTIFFLGEGAYDSIQNLKAIQDRNRTPENTINSWDDLVKKLNAFTNWDFRSSLQH